MKALQITDLQMRFDGLEQAALDIAHLSIAKGSHVVISGASGSGKTTLINAIAGFEKPTRGKVLWDGTDLYALSAAKRDAWRGQMIGLMMQDFHLFAGLNALDNVLLPARLKHIFSRPPQDEAQALLDRVGLGDKYFSKIEFMSRGEMQRVALARALSGRPSIILADEPTASLDAENGQIVIGLLHQLADDLRATLITISHDAQLIQSFPRHITLQHGKIIADRQKT